MAFVEADAVSAEYYEEVGWSVSRLMRLADEIGYERAHGAWEEALAYAVDRLLDTSDDAVIALGAGHSHVSSPKLFTRVAAALATADRVVLLRPHPDLVVSTDELRRRCIECKGHGWTRGGIDWLVRWTNDGRDEQVATEVAYTLGETPDETASRLYDPH